MFCSQCGRELLDSDIYCVNCGKEICQTLQKRNLENTIVQFGKPALRGWGKFKPTRPLPSEYAWLQERCTFIFFNQHFVVINGDEKRNRFMDATANVGLPVAGAVISAGITALRAGLDKLKNNKLEFSSQTIDFLYTNKQLVWCENKDVECWNYKRKPLLFYPVPEGFQFLCNFKIDNINIPCFLIFYCGPNVPNGWDEKNGISLQESFSGLNTNKFFKNILKATGVKDKELFDLMERDRIDFVKI